MSGKARGLRVSLEDDEDGRNATSIDRLRSAATLEENANIPDRADIVASLSSTTPTEASTPGLSSIPNGSRGRVIVPGTPKTIFVPMHTNDFDFVGRVQELSLISDRITELLRGGHPGTTVLEGPSGVGKSHLIHRLLKLPNSSDLTVYYSSCVEEESHTPFFVWREIFKQFFNVPSDASALEAKKIITEQFEVFPQLGEYGPLIKAVLPLDIAENHLTKHLRGKVRANHTIDFCLRLLQHACSLGPKVIILENEQWMDSMSWKLFLHASKLLQPVLIIVSSTLFGCPVPVHYYDEIIATGFCQILKVAPLSQRELRDLLCIKLQLPQNLLPNDVVTIFFEKSKGHPLYAEELLQYAKEHNLIKTSDHKAPLFSMTDIISKFAVFSSELTELVVKRLERLDSHKRHVLRCASVLGREFNYLALLDVASQTFVEKKKPAANDRHAQDSSQGGQPPGIVPAEPPRESSRPIESHPTTVIRKDMKILEAKDILRRKTTTSELQKIYSFRHDAIRSISYKSIKSGKKDMHFFAVLWLESYHSGSLSLYRASLGYHWLRAKRYDKAMDYFSQAADDAMSISALPEAIHFIQLAIASAEKDKTQTPEKEDRVAAWHELLGVAYMEMGEWSRGYEIFMQVLSENGDSRLPRSGVIPCLISTFIEEASRKIESIIGPGWWLTDAQSKHRYQHSARLHTHMSLIAFYEKNIPLFASNTARALRIISALPDSEELPMVYAMAGISYGKLLENVNHALGQMVSQSYLDKALVMIKHASDPYVRGWVCHLHACQSFRQGYWDSFVEAEIEAHKYSVEAGDRQFSDYCQYVMGLCEFIKGDYHSSYARFEEIMNTSMARSDIVSVVWARVGIGLVLVRTGRIPDAVAWLEETHNILDVDLFLEKFNCGTILTMARCFNAGRSYALQLQLSEMTQDIEKGDLSAIYFPIFMASCEAAYQCLFYSLEENGLEEPAIRLARTQLRRWVIITERFAGYNPFAYTIYLLYAGLEQMLLDAHLKALNLLRQAVRYAGTLAMPYELARAHWAISRIYQIYAPDKSQQEFHLKQANDLFKDIGCHHELRKLKALMNPPSHT